ncbi:hypothetical protein BT69DRAFT_998411 [Atractiella rhizophila]|nr:hypothetical protein BT69DRAFT_998411 [Atractiella rhizophila]
MSIESDWEAPPQGKAPVRVPLLRGRLSNKLTQQKHVSPLSSQSWLVCSHSRSEAHPRNLTNSKTLPSLGVTKFEPRLQQSPFADNLLPVNGIAGATKSNSSIFGHGVLPGSRPHPPCLNERNVGLSANGNSANGQKSGWLREVLDPKDLALVAGQHNPGTRKQRIEVENHIVPTTHSHAHKKTSLGNSDQVEVECRLLSSLAVLDLAPKPQDCPGAGPATSTRTANGGTNVADKQTQNFSANVLSGTAIRCSPLSRETNCSEASLEFPFQIAAQTDHLRTYESVMRLSVGSMGLVREDKDQDPHVPVKSAIPRAPSPTLDAVTDAISKTCIAGNFSSLFHSHFTDWKSKGHQSYGCNLHASLRRLEDLQVGGR